MRGHELAMALRAAYLAMHRRTDSVLAPLGVTADQFVVLAALADENVMIQRELVARTSSDPNTMRAMIVLLERKGLIERSSNPADGRARTVALTRSGRSVLKRLWRKSEPLRSRMLASFEPGEHKRLLASLRRVATSVHAPQASASTTRRRVQAVD